MTYTVSLPHGRWMSGYLHSFKTKRAAEAFMDRWNQVEVNSGNRSVCFDRSGNQFFAQVSA